MQTLTGTMRSKTDKLSIIRSNGMIPAVVYGAHVKNTLISVLNIDFKKVFKESGISNSILLDIKSKKIDVLIHDIQVDPVKGFPIHIDFLAIDINKPIEVIVPLEFIGIAPAEKNALGSLVKVLHEVNIKGLSKDLPHTIVVDISSLETLDNQIHVKDIVLPKGVSMITEDDEVVALVAIIKEEIEEAPIDISAIEVDKKDKKEEEGEKLKSE